jgi:hypothetical protein
VWSYALEADSLAGTLMQAKPFVGTRQKVGTLLIDIRGYYRANPLLHVDSMLGVGTGNIIWSNYESVYYFFPVQVKDPARYPPSNEFEQVALLDDPREATERAERWAKLLTRYHDEIDVLVEWGSDPRLDALNARWFEPYVQFSQVRVLRHKPKGKVGAGEK